MGKYEIMYILVPTLEDEARKNEIAKLHNILAEQKCTVKDVKEWGLRDFAYPMKKLNKGYYVVIKVTAEPAGLNEFSRLAKLDSNVVRFLITVDHD